jgi:hypothetical protein
MFTNILLYLAAVDDEVTMTEAAYITDCSEKLTSICDGAGVMRSKAPLDPSDYVTSAEPAFTARTGTATSGGVQTAPEGASAEEEAEKKPSLEELMAQLDELVEEFDRAQTPPSPAAPAAPQSAPRSAAPKGGLFGGGMPDFSQLSSMFPGKK